MIDYLLCVVLVVELYVWLFLWFVEVVLFMYYVIYVDGQFDIYEMLLYVLCCDMGIDVLYEGVMYYVVQLLCGWYLKWECYIEFLIFMFVVLCCDIGYFDDCVIVGILVVWFVWLVGICFVVVWMELLLGDVVWCVCGDLWCWIDGFVFVGSYVFGGGKVFCDWYVCDDGFMCFFVVDEDFCEEQGGWLLQCLYEIEMYWMMVLFVLFVVCWMSCEFDEIYVVLYVLMQWMDVSGVDGDDVVLFVKFMYFVVWVELLLGLGVCFSVLCVYEKFVFVCIQELCEECIEGMLMFVEFMEWCFVLVMEICCSVWVCYEQIVV